MHQTETLIVDHLHLSATHSEKVNLAAVLKLKETIIRLHKASLWALGMF